MQLRIHRAGLGLLIIEISLFTLCTLSGLISRQRIFAALTLFSLLIFGFTLYFFRNPVRKIIRNEGVILAPADGRIREISTDGFTNGVGPCQMVSIYLSLWNVHVNRSPVSGEVIQKRSGRGRYLPAFLKEAGRHNAYTLVEILNDTGLYAVRQMTGFLARRIVCNLDIGDRVGQGDCYGIIQFGSRVNLYLPPSASILINEGDRVKGGETIIGKINIAHNI